MEANRSGIALTKAELRMLREFASKEPEDRDRFGVQFTVEGTEESVSEGEDEEQEDEEEKPKRSRRKSNGKQPALPILEAETAS